MGSNPVLVEILHFSKLTVRFFKKIQDWILKSERIRKWILRFFTRQINPRYFGTWCVKGTEDSSLPVDSSVPLTHHDLFSEETQNLFSDVFRF